MCTYESGVREAESDNLFRRVCLCVRGACALITVPVPHLTWLEPEPDECDPLVSDDGRGMTGIYRPSQNEPPINTSHVS